MTANNAILTNGSDVVTMHSAKVDYDVTKSWKNNPIPNPSSKWVETTLTSQADSGDTTIVVDSATGLSVNDYITLLGADAAGDTNPAEDVKVTAITGSTLTLETELINTFASGSTVIRKGRVISLDFNQTVETITIDGKITKTATEDIGSVRDKVLKMALQGGSIKVETDIKNFPSCGITKITITQLPGNGDIVDMFHVIVNLTNTGKALGE